MNHERVNCEREDEYRILPTVLLFIDCQPTTNLSSRRRRETDNYKKMNSIKNKSEMLTVKELSQMLFLLLSVNAAKRATFAVFVLAFFSLSLNAQSILTLEEAKAVTLANNYGIKVAQNNVQIAENNTDKRANGLSLIHI